MSPRMVRRLLAIHRWTGLIAAANLAVLVVTGVLLLFEPEIEGVLGAPASGPEARISLAQAVDLARASHGGTAVFIARSFGDFPDVIVVGISPTGRLGDAVAVAVDRGRGVVTAAPAHDSSFFGTVWRLHTELLAGPTGTVVVGGIGALLLMSLLTGLCCYGPMMRGFVLRGWRERPLRSAIADIHKIVGIGVLAWGLVVASTGMILAWGVPRARAVGVTMLASSGAVRDGVSTLDAAVASAEATRPKAHWWTVVLPRGDGRYGVVMRGGEGLDKRVVTLARVEAEPPFAVVSSETVARALVRLGPIHFAEFGGLGLRIIWALFAIGLLGLAVSGLTMRALRL